MNYFKAPYYCVTLLFCLLISACNDQAEFEARETLASIDDTSQLEPTEKKQQVISKSESEIRAAYINYIAHSSKQDLSRSQALQRLANIEFKLSEKLLNETADEQLASQLAEQKLDRVIELLKTSINDYPNAKSNDISLYQLAKAYDQKGLYEETHDTLQQLTDNFPKSRFYLEAQFRLAEYAFVKRQYLLAEDKYTEIIASPKNNLFYEKALYKRGWSRFKQEFYIEAADDFVRVINQNDFSNYQQLSVGNKNLFDEYFRALALSFSYLGGAEPLNIYLQDSEYAENDYYIYRSLSAVFFKQQQYADAATTLDMFINYNAASQFAPLAALQIIEIWKEAGFTDKRSAAFEHFYDIYQPNSRYWKQQRNINKAIYDQTTRALKAHILAETATYHKRYQATKKQQDFLHAEQWYKNYLSHFSSHARQDNIHFLLASLYNTQGDTQKAVLHYQLAAFDGTTIINKDAAYQSILLAASLQQSSQNVAQKNSWLDNLMTYSTRYAQQYPIDKNALKVIAYASDIAYNNKRYNETIALAELAVSNKQPALINEINIIKANAYFHSQQYEIAESAYLALTATKGLSTTQKTNISEGLSLAIFYQGEQAIKNNQIEQGIQHYARIVEVAPTTEAASAGLYDAIALSIEHEQWLPAIVYIKTFRKRFPNHKYTTDVTKKLSVAYLNSEQGVAAAQELENLSGRDSGTEYKMAALLKAAQLYQNNNETKAAIRSYEKYVKTYKTPFPAYQESLYQLILLNDAQKAFKKSLTWHKEVLQADQRNPDNVKNDRTNFIAATSAITLARDQNALFKSINLVQPLNKNLQAKKISMSASVNYYARASSFGIEESATEATYAIATIYNDFSQALLNSEIPKHLDEDEQEEYMFLLEDQAFPFEEKAIEFHEINLRYSADDINDQWLQKSLQQLQLLFPLRYSRQPKLEDVINVLH
jgi:outer membrane protein assembly factor BamD (BamD/ComL family)